MLELEREPLRLRTASGATPSRRGVGFSLERRGLLIPVHPNRHVVPTEVAKIIGHARNEEREKRREQVRAFVLSGDHAPRRARFSMDPGAFAMALINEYPPGAPIGWHRDAPQYDIVAGISLLSSCRMKFRPYVRPHAKASTQGGRRTATHEIALERRSAYLMTGAARNAYEHHIPAVTTLRYSITFRTLRA